MENNTAEKTSVGSRILKAIGVKGDFKTAVVPMINYCYTNIFLGGGGYIISMYFLIFLTDVVNLDIKYATSVSMIAIIWDAITDPIMGIITDRTRSKTGKHRRYLLWGAPILIVSYSLLWNSFGLDGKENPLLCVIYFTFAYMLYKTAYTVISVPHTAMLPELAPEYNLRTQYTSVSYIFNSCGMVPSYIILLILLRVFGSAGEISEKSKAPFLITGIILSFIYAGAVTLTYKTVKEKSSLDNNPEPLDIKYLINEYVLVFKNKSFRQYFFMNFFWQIATGFYNTTKVFYIKYLANQYNSYALLNALAGVFETAAFPLNYALTMKQGKKKCGTIVTPFMILGLAIGLFMQPSTQGTALGTVMRILMMLSVAFYPFGMSGLGFVSNNVFPDLTDVDEVITGRRREGVMSTFKTLIQKTVSGAMTGTVGLILGTFGLVTGSEVTQYEAETGLLYEQSSNAVFGIRLCVAIIPIIAAILSWVLLRRFQMTKEDHTMIRAVLATKHKYGNVKLTDEQKERIEIVCGQKIENTWLGKDNCEEIGESVDRNEDGEYIILALAEKEAAAQKEAAEANKITE